MTNPDLLRYIEESQFLVLPELPGASTWFDDEGLRGRQTPIDNHTANGVLVTRLTAAQVDAAVLRVQQRFASTPHGWIVTSRTTPNDLGQRLVAHGYAMHKEASGMVLRNLEQARPSPKGVRVRLANLQDLALAAEVNAEAYGIALDVSTLIMRCHLETTKVSSRIYLAYPSGSDIPAGVAIMVPMPGTRVVLMASAATVAEFRGQGLYSALIARRIEDARALGADAAIVHAVTSTSAPICRRRGYEEVERLRMYALPSPA